MNIKEVLENAMIELNKPENPWEITIEGNNIVASWKWMDATFFSPNEVNDDVKTFKYIVTLFKNGKYKEKDIAKQSNIRVSGNGLSFSTGGFVGSTAGKSVTFGLGKDHNSGKTGFVTAKFDTAIIKQPIKEYLKRCGFKKKGLFF